MRSEGNPYTLPYIYTLEIIYVLSVIMRKNSNATKEIREVEIACTILFFPKFFNFNRKIAIGCKLLQM